ncbi:WD40 repeat domain-containing serine/threonine-protein kinase [Nonomuraea gerenzanensis]|uniref:High-affnity carbon uptake protein Hat/HatR n=1 Tax=Nonomuraea gerenzanensis TaxID=93944 RepID=A0A1M4EA14_9ACTN|nr:WD40 repeat domain-containing serine/threonine-protein kinase [Nonomuraea gerenzanensis]UBU17910.1 protein kinase [Nonomuraea gerenzanensis]SBO95705.1 High-affnity carbon uptake protein Hat/HatR [Nonomuraea gerenzanensis]
MNGDRLGRYWLAGQLGAGGQGVVYEAYDEAANRVAVKVLHAYLAGDSVLRRRFMREVSAAQRVASFCTARIVDHDLEGERPYLVTEFVAGPSLRRAAPFAGDELHRLAVGVATALVAVHQAGVVHRDLKPENVLLGPDGPRVIDFGIARAAGLSMTSTGELTGTPMYMAPEVFSGGRADAAADVFAWGALVYFAATGRNAFEAPTTVAVIHRLLTHEPDLTVLQPGLRGLVAEALSKDPARRPSAQALLTGLLGGAAQDAPAARGGLVSGGAPMIEGAAMPEGALMAEGAQAAASVRPPDALAGEPALGLVAEQAYAALRAPARELAKRLLLRLVDVRDGQEEARRARLEELTEGADGSAYVLGELEAAQLITRERDVEAQEPAADTVSLARPALLRAWPRLQEWVGADREALARHRRLGEAARHWAAHARNPDDLLRGTALREALTWVPTLPSHLALNPLEQEFVAAAKARADARRRRTGLVTTGVAVLLVTALVAGVIAWQQTRAGQASTSRLADQQTQERARLVALRADAMREDDPAKAMLLSVAAYRIAPVPEAEAAVLSSLARPERLVFKDPNLNNTGRALSQDGSVLVSAGADQVHAYDVRTGAQTRAFGGVGQGPFTTALSPDGDTLALGSDGRIRLWSLKRGELIGEGKIMDATGRYPQSLRFSPGGGYLEATANGGGPWLGFWSTRTRKPVPIGEPSTSDVEVAPGDRLALVSTTRRTEARTPPDGAASATRLPAARGGRLAGFTPDGKRVALLEDERTRLWNVATGKPEEPEFPAAGGVEFSADGRFVLTYAGPPEFGTPRAPSEVTLSRVADGARLTSFTTTAAIAERPRFSADNRSLTLLDDAGQATVHDLTRYTAPARAVPEEFAGPRLSADGGTVLAVGGRRIATWSGDGFTERGKVLDLDALRLVGGEEDEELMAALSPDGRTAAVANNTDRGIPLTLIDTATGRKLGSIPDAIDNDWGHTLSFSPDGRLLALSATAPNDYFGQGSLLIAEVADPRRVTRLSGIHAGALSFSPDGRYLTTGDPSGIDVIDLTTRKALPRAQGPGTMAGSWMVFDPTGRRAVSPYGSRGVALWDTGTWQPAGQVFRMPGDVLDAAFSPDGSTLVISHDHRVTLVDLATGRQRGEPRTAATVRYGQGLDDPEPRLAFLPSGDLRVVGHDGTYEDLPLTGERALARVCARAQGSLSAEDWRELVGPGEPFEVPCGKA